MDRSSLRSPWTPVALARRLPELDNVSLTTLWVLAVAERPVRQRVLVTVAMNAHRRAGGGTAAPHEVRTSLRLLRDAGLATNEGGPWLLTDEGTKVTDLFTYATAGASAEPDHRRRPATGGRPIDGDPS